MTTPAPAPASAAPAAVPGKTLGIVGLILAFIGPLSLIGLILSIIAKVQSKNAGVKNTPATAGIIVGIVVIVLTIILWVTVFATLLSACAGLEPGVYDTGNGGTLTCG